MCNPGWPRNHFIVKNDFEFLILMASPVLRFGACTTIRNSYSSFNVILVFTWTDPLSSTDILETSPVKVAEEKKVQGGIFL